MRTETFLLQVFTKALFEFNEQRNLYNVVSSVSGTAKNDLYFMYSTAILSIYFMDVTLYVLTLDRVFNLFRVINL